DRNRSHWSTSKTPSYTKSVSWQHHRTYPPETPLLSGLKFFGIYRTQKNADITDRLLSVPNSADPKAMYLSTERVPDILGTDVF
ncbi:hypothetical protein, partial [Escherichia coli]|uniref:hypothetical protein n=1 Tax=Escherichia coli TaxID=562 RepID=UPI0021C5F623